MSAAKVTVAAMIWTADLDQPGKVIALGRARLWAWYGALQSNTMAERLEWREVEHHLKGAEIAVRMGL